MWQLSSAFRGIVAAFFFCAVDVQAASPQAKELRAAAESNDAEAQYLLGRQLAYGIGVERNYDEAIKWLRLASEQNIREAKFELALRYAFGQGVSSSTSQALNYLRQAAEQGMIFAQTMLADALFGGMLNGSISVEKDHIEAAKWYRRAAELGDASSQSKLATLYGWGKGVPQDPAEAFRWTRKAVEQGHVLAYKRLADHYLHGKGVPRDSVQAIRWYQRAAAEELSTPPSIPAPDATITLGELYEAGTGVNQDYVEAYAYYSLAAAVGDQECRKRRDALAVKYLRGPVLISAQQRARELQGELASVKATATGSDQAITTAPQPSVAGGASALKPKATGSGFAVAAEGYVVTNWHVVENANRIELMTARGAVAATVVASDPSNDLAILRAAGRLANALSIRTSRGIKIGSEVFTVGFPNPALQGYSPKFTRGDISSIAGAEDDPRYFQISVPIQPGNSGGALCDTAGRVVGVVAARLSTRTAIKTSGALPENVNYAIKSSYLLALLESLELPAGTFASEPDVQTTAEDARTRAQQAAVLVVVY